MFSVVYKVLEMQEKYVNLSLKLLTKEFNIMRNITWSEKKTVAERNVWNNSENYSSFASYFLCLFASITIILQLREAPLV